MTGFADMPASALIKLGNANRVSAVGLEILHPETLILKVRYQRAAGGTFLVPSTFAIMFAEAIDEAVKRRRWEARTPQEIAITADDRTTIAQPPEGGAVTSGHVLATDNAIILALGFQNNLGQCLRVAENHAAWLSEQLLPHRDQKSLVDVRQARSPAGRPN